MRAQRGIEDKRYEYSLHRLAEAESLKSPDPAEAAQIAYLKGVCYAGLNRQDEAKAMFKFVVDHFPNTSPGYMAKEKLSRLENN